MFIVTLKILGIWFSVAAFTGLAMGAMIERAERVRKEEFLSFVFATISSCQDFR